VLQCFLDADLEADDVAWGRVSQISLAEPVLAVKYARFLFRRCRCENGRVNSVRLVPERGELWMRRRTCKTVHLALNIFHNADKELDSNLYLYVGEP
jgi:hypothetical protein